MMRIFFLASLALAAVSLGFLAVRADEPVTSVQAEATTPAASSVCTAYLKGEYLATIKPADFLDGDKISGKFLGFDNDFAKFRVKGSKEEIFIPKSAILYMRGTQSYFGIRN